MKAGETAAVAEWAVAEGLRGTSEGELLAGFCERLVAAGLPLSRGYVTLPTLHPIFAGYGYRWRHGPEALHREEYDKTDFPRQAWAQSPFKHMLDNRLGRLHIRLTGDGPLDFSVLEELRRQGATDYVAFASRFGDDANRHPLTGIMSSWASDSASGFGADHLANLERLLPSLALAFKSASTLGVARNLIATYIGRDAGERVLSGEIQRGSTEVIRAVLWYGDLRGFTRIADANPHDQVLGMLNDYFECLVESVHEQGGEVLKFMGDGLLAIFKLTDDADMCSRALDAAEQALGRIAVLARTRASDGLPAPTVALALHMGEVMYGNIGAQDRLDFTVIGPAVNEVSRIEAMCRSLECDLIASSAFAAGADRCRGRLVSLGRYALRGVRRPQELFTLEAAAES